MGRSNVTLGHFYNDFSVDDRKFHSTKLQYLEGQQLEPVADSNAQGFESDQGRSHNVARIDKA